MWLILVSWLSWVTSFISLRKCNNMFSSLINCHFNKFVWFWSAKIKLSCACEIKCVINFTNTKHIINLNIIFYWNPEAAIIFLSESNLFFSIWSPFWRIITPITFPFIRSPWISYLYNSIKLVLTVKNFCYSYNSISMTWNNS